MRVAATHVWLASTVHPVLCPRYKSHVVPTTNTVQRVVTPLYLCPLVITPSHCHRSRISMMLISITPHSQISMGGTSGTTLITISKLLREQKIGVWVHMPSSIIIIACEPGSYCLSDGIRRMCPGGRYGSSSGLSSALCTGPCPAGYYCPQGSSAPTMHSCGDHSVYCPVGSDAPFPVLPGWYAAGGLTANTSTTERKCEPGSYCSGDGVVRLCPSGRYGGSFGLVSCIVVSCVPMYVYYVYLVCITTHSFNSPPPHNCMYRVIPTAQGHVWPGTTAQMGLPTPTRLCVVAPICTAQAQT